MRKFLLGTAILSFVVFAGTVGIGSRAARADSVSSTSVSPDAPPVVAFPIRELGNCKDKAACKAFCDLRANQPACTSFAESHGLAKRHPVLLPKACTSKESCIQFCSDAAHEEECLTVAERASIISKAEHELRRHPVLSVEKLRAVSSTPEFGDATSSARPSGTIEPKRRAPVLKLATSSSDGGMRGDVKPLPAVCVNSADCELVCRDTAGQFYNNPDCVNYRELRAKLKELEQSGEIPPDANLLPRDSACPDATTCVARCTNENSPYFLKPECVDYREKHPPAGAMSGRSLFFANVLMNLKDLFR